MEDDSMHKKVGTPHASQLIMKVNIGSAVKTASDPKGQKRKWDKNPPKDKGTLTKKKTVGCYQSLMFQL
jgi:hypothetical protein